MNSSLLRRVTRCILAALMAVGFQTRRTAAQSESVQLAFPPGIPPAITAAIEVSGMTQGSLVLPNHLFSSTIANALVAGRNNGTIDESNRYLLDVVVHATLPKDASSFTLALSPMQIQTLLDANIRSFAIQNSMYSIRMDLAAIQSIRKQSVGSVLLKMEKILVETKDGNSTNSSDDTLPSSPTYQFGVLYNNNGTIQHITNLGAGRAVVSIPHHGSGDSFIEETNGSRLHNSLYDSETQSLIFSTNAFSSFAIGQTSDTILGLDNHWAKDALQYMAGRNIIDPSADGTVQANQIITKEMLATMLEKLSGIDPGKFHTLKFTDVGTNANSAYINWAVASHIIPVNGSTSFSPNQPVSREEMAGILFNYLKAVGYKFPVNMNSAGFGDVSTINSNHIDAIRQLQMAGILMPKEGDSFQPKATASLAELSAMLHRYIKVSIDPLRSQGWVTNDSGQYRYINNGSALSGPQIIHGTKYFFEPNGDLKTGWVKDGNVTRYYEGNDMVTGKVTLTNDNQKFMYYFNSDGSLATNRWVTIEGIPYFFQENGSMATNIRIGDYIFDANGNTTLAPRPRYDYNEDSYTDPYGKGKEVILDDVVDPDKDSDAEARIGDVEENVDSYDPIGSFKNIKEDLVQALPPYEPINYLLYGYNVLDYGLINSDFIDKKYPIFDTDKVTGSHYIVAPNTKSDLDTLHSKSAKELNRSLKIGVEASYSGVFFSGSIDTEYNLSTSMSEQTELLKHVQYHRFAEYAYIVPPSTLKTLLSTDFTNRLADIANAPTEVEGIALGKQLLNDYGTHAITQYYLGGRAELTFRYTNTEYKSSQELILKAQATYRTFSGSVSAQDKTDSAYMHSTSSIKFTSFGGKNVTGSDQKAISEEYASWVESIQQWPVISGIANFKQSMLPIWDLIDNTTAKSHVYKAFLEDLETAKFELSKFDAVPLYVADIGVYAHKNSSDALAMIPNNYTKVLINPNTTSTTVFDANKGARGDYIYIAYRLSPNKSEALVDIQTIAGDSSSIKCASGYNKISIDLNKGAGGKYIYLCTRKASEGELSNPNTEFIKEIRGLYTGSQSIPSNWKWPSRYVNLNASATQKDAPVLYLAIRKLPEPPKQE